MGNIKFSNKTIGFLCLALSVIVEGISMLQSGEYWSGYAIGYWGTLSVVLGASIDACQVLFPLITVACFVSEKWIACMFFGLLAAGAVYYSFLTSEAFSASKTNEQIINTIQQSDEYKNTQKVLESATNTETLEDSIKRLKVSKASDEAQIRKDYAPLIADVRRLKMLTTKGGVQDLTREMNDKIANLQKVIDDKEALFNQKGTEAINVSKELSNVGKDTKATKGIMPLATKRNPADPEGEAAKLNTWWNVFLILAGLGLSIGAGMFLSKEESKKSVKTIVQPTIKSQTNNKQDVPDIKKTTKDELQTASLQSLKQPKKREKISIYKPKKSKSIIDGIDNENLKVYLEFLLSECKLNGDQAPGHTLVKDKMTSTVHRQLIGTLRTLNYLEACTVGKMKRTLIKNREGLEKLYKKL